MGFYHECVCACMGFCIDGFVEEWVLCMDKFCAWMSVHGRFVHGWVCA